MYSKEQTEQADFILKTLHDKGGSMEYSDMAHLLNDRYNYDDAPFHLLKQLSDIDGLVIRNGNHLMLTQEGRKAAKRGTKAHLAMQDFLDRIKENKDIVSVVASICTIAGTVIGLLIQYIL